MSQSPFSIQQLPISRSILLPASFAAGGALLLILFVALMGCALLADADRWPRSEPQNSPNAVLCECTCESPFDPLAVPGKNYIAVGSDDATQALIPGTAALTGSIIELGQNGLAAVRFQSIGVPPFAKITEARIQFTAGATSTAGNVADLHIRVVDQVDAVFADGNPPQPIDLSTLLLLNGEVPWAPGPWTVDDAGIEQLTPDLADLLGAIVARDDYKPTSAVAFVIGGFGRRSARSFEGATSQASPYLTITYEPLKTITEFAACFNPDTETPEDVCSGKVHNNVTDIAAQCKVASACTCTVKTAPDPTTFAQACNQSCGPVSVPADCNPEDFAQATQAPGQLPVCIAQSPLGSALFGRRSACDLDPSQSGVTVTLFDAGRADGHASSDARGRIEFAGPRCVGDSCDTGVSYRLQMGDMRFDGRPLPEEPVTELTGVGKSTDPIRITRGAGLIPAASLQHSGRGRQVGSNPRAYFLDRRQELPLSMNVNIAADRDGWTSGGVCTVHGTLVHTNDIVISADLRGTLVNQPPTADAGPDQQQIECNDVGRATFTLDGSKSVDPDNNVAFFGWFRGSRTGDLVGSLPRADVAQPMRTRVPYVFKVIDTFGQYDEATTTVSVVDTTPPRLSVVLSPSVLWPPNHELVRITATITVDDACDPTPSVRLLSIESNEPDNRRSDGNTAGDIQEAAFGADDRTFLLRAERSGRGAGRVYTVTYEARDNNENATVHQATVTVPHNR